ncbi:hypothetical protein C2S52_010266 [Perilla frutescens var. hirtella]|nr:hypothetical protein C2S52_010266 [Perilla frutescens var. hirtella]KAH6817137.1 hypothetical protein C2S51_000740 [Perilla frutescens var. frutescens]
MWTSVTSSPMVEPPRREKMSPARLQTGLHPKRTRRNGYIFWSTISLSIKMEKSSPSSSRDGSMC